MKRYHYGTHAQCMVVLRKSEYMNKKFNGSGYDYYDLYETTPEEYETVNDYVYSSTVSKRINKYYVNNELYTLILYRNESE